MSTQTKYRTCNLCEAICGLEITIENNKVISIQGDKNDPFSKGHICPKAVALQDIHEDPDRLKFPIKKINGEWKSIRWEEAFEFVANKLYDIQSKHGNDSVGIYQGNPSVHNLGTSLFSPNFVRALKTKNRFSATSVDQLAHHLAGEFMLGHMNLIPVPDIDHTDFWVIMGGNPLVSNGSLMTAPNVSGRLRDIQKRGGKVIVIDPRRTETADKADQHIFVKPGSDIFILLSIIRHVLQNDLSNLGHLKELVNNDDIESIKELTAPYSFENASKRTGIAAEVLEALANEYVNAQKAVWYGRLGISANKYGALCHWAINTLNILTGHFDTAGGSMLTSAAVNLAQGKSRTPKFNRWQSRVKGLPETGGELPSACIADEILTPGEGQIKAFITSCGNPVLSVPNGKKLDEAFESLEFMVSIDIYLNETTRHADIILPPATGLETAHYPTAFHNLAVRNTANYSEAVFEKDPEGMYDYEIFKGLQKALEKLTLSLEDQSRNEAYYSLTPEDMLGFALQSGTTGITLKDLKNHPSGIDLGPLKSIFPGRLLTDDKKIHLLPDIYRDQLKKIAVETEKNNGLLLIGRRHLRSNNSWLHNSYRMVKGRERCTLLIHPKDAEETGVKNDQWATIKSEIGEVRIKVEISDEMMPGTVSIPHGWGHNRAGIKMRVAQDHAGISLNDLIDNDLVDPLCGVSIINGIPISIGAEA